MIFLLMKSFFFLKMYKIGELLFNVGNKFGRNQRDLIIELKLGGTSNGATIKNKDIEFKCYI